MAAANYPPPGEPGDDQASPERQARDLQGLQAEELQCRTIQRPCSRPARRHDPGQRRHLPRGRQDRGPGQARPEAHRQRQAPARSSSSCKGAKGAKAQNGVIINGADGVTVQGLVGPALQGQRLLRREPRRLHVTHLVAIDDGTYGVYAFNTKGGTMSRHRGLRQQRLRLLHRADPAADQADALDRHATSRRT